MPNYVDRKGKELWVKKEVKHFLRYRGISYATSDRRHDEKFV